MFVYFVSFMYFDHDLGVNGLMMAGNAEIKSKEKIESIKDIYKFEKCLIQKGKNIYPTIINFQLLRLE